MEKTSKFDEFTEVELGCDPLEMLQCWHYKGYEVFITQTVFGSRRICVGEIGDMSLTFNWCAGPDDGHARGLLGLAKSVIDLDMPKFPASSRVKPYHNDPDFVAKMAEVGYEPMFDIELKPTKKFFQ